MVEQGAVISPSDCARASELEPYRWLRLHEGEDGTRIPSSNSEVVPARGARYICILLSFATKSGHVQLYEGLISTVCQPEGS